MNAQSARAQTPAPASVRAPASVAWELFAGSEMESYVRALQNTGHVAPHPWALRAFSAGDVRRIAGESLESHPWAGRYDFVAETERTVEYGFLRARTTTIYNSAFPFGGNDGPVWAGRGLTGAVQVGGFARLGPLSLVVAPIAFHARNRAFDLAPTGVEGDGVFRSPLTPHNIDLPQRFGEGGHGRLDGGNSTLRLDGRGITAGVSTAAQQWGPMSSHPLVLGANPGGFPHAFIGTQRPLNVWLGRLHGRLVAGRLDQSDHSPSTHEDPRRLMTGLVVAFQPRGVPGLELGMARFSHLAWPDDGVTLSLLTQPLRSFIGAKDSDAVKALTGEPPDNELVSVFARWNVPSAGVEVFGEFVRVDGTADLRQLAMEPDDLSGYALGIRRVWAADESERLTVFRGEIFSTVSSHRERGGARQRFAFRGRPMYQHSRVTQGHTHRGQLLATPAGHGGAGSTLGIDRYHTGGRWSVEFERRLERDGTVGVRPDEPADTDVSYALGGSVLRFTGPLDLEFGVRGVYNLNRHLQEDAFNLNLRVGAVIAY